VNQNDNAYGAAFPYVALPNSIAVEPAELSFGRVAAADMR
jgi:hypothetical protein